ncbi:MAG: cob(I)yrinic acid a,c-diamide adenosyltransferase [Desulfurococcales archaeon]|nr:cob(I)yrinic acid a,c-diamide adenosyltransferase [Desulfurococcales archaeon]
MTGRLYTRTGDEGTTFCYFLNKRIPKDHPLMEFLGTLDEANSHIGLARSLLPSMPELSDIHRILVEVQRLMFKIGFLPSRPTSLSENDILWMEKLIDKYYGEAPLKSFILPGGHKAASQLHVARTVTRRAERRLVQLVNEGLYPKLALKAINRLSDLLFALALYVNRILKVEETPV